MEENISFKLARSIMKLFAMLRPKKHLNNIKPIETMVIMCTKGMLHKHKYVTPSMICNELGISKSNLTNILNSLENNGFLKREFCPDDRRNVSIILKPKADEIHSLFHKQMDKQVNELSDYLGKEDTEKLIELLSKSLVFFENQERKQYEQKK